MNQLELEMKYNNANRATVLEEYKESLLAPCLQYMSNYYMKEVPDYKGAEEIHQEVLRIDAESFIWNILTNVLLDGKLSLQAVFGKVLHKIELDMYYRKGKVLGVFVDAICSSPYFETKQLTHQGLVFLKTTKPISIDSSQYGYALPRLSYVPVTSNDDAGYETEKFHAITGGKLKEHDGELCLDHINRLNSTTCCVNNRIAMFVEPVFDDTPKFKNGAYETEAEIEEKRKQFIQLTTEVPVRNQIMYSEGNRFHLLHRYDTRGRTYCKSRHFDYIGNKHLRAQISTTTHQHLDGANQYF